VPVASPCYLPCVSAAEAAASSTALAARRGPLKRCRPPDACCAAAAMLSTTLAISLHGDAHPLAAVEWRCTYCGCASAAKLPMPASQPSRGLQYAALQDACRARCGES
jgi:hypothetical protein